MEWAVDKSDTSTGLFHVKQATARSMRRSVLAWLLRNQARILPSLAMIKHAPARK